MIRIIDEPVIQLTTSEFRQRKMEYHQQFAYYHGPIPTFEQWLLDLGTPTVLQGRI